MDIGNISGELASQAADSVGILVLRNAIKIQEQSAMQLLEAIPVPASNPPNLGQAVDVRA